MNTRIRSDMFAQPRLQPPLAAFPRNLFSCPRQHSLVINFSNAIFQTFRTTPSRDPSIAISSKHLSWSLRGSHEQNKFKGVSFGCLNC